MPAEQNRSARMRVAINLLSDDPRNPTGAHWGWTRMIPEMARRLEPGEELHLLVSPKSRLLHQGYGPGVSYITYPWSNERRTPRTLSEHLYSPLRLPLSRIDVFNTLMAPLVNISWSLVIHMKTMHAFSTPDAIAPLPRLYRRMNYPRSVRVADAIIINSESLRSEIQRHLKVDADKLKLIYEAVDHDLFRPGDAAAARARIASYGITKPFVLFVSSLWKYKNCDGLLRAWALARGELGDRQLAIVGAWPRPGVPRLAAFARGRTRHLAGRHLHRRNSARGNRSLLPGGGRLRLPVVQRDIRAPHLGGHGLRLSGGDLRHHLHAGNRGRSCGPVRSQGPGVHRPGHRRSGRARSRPPARPRAAQGRSIHLGRHGRCDPRRVPRGCRTPTEATEMRIPVTTGAGFIGSHVGDLLPRLVSRARAVLVEA